MVADGSYTWLTLRPIVLYKTLRVMPASMLCVLLFCFDNLAHSIQECR